MMKRLVRNPGKFEALEAFTAFSRENGYKLKSPEDTEKFLQHFGESLKASQENQILLHGKRMEACFGQVAAGLHGCSIIKSEDTGDVISYDSEILLPDYRLVLKNGMQIFVEVKNSNLPNPTSTYLLRKDYIAKLQRYSELNGVPLYFAIYYRCLRMWTLLSVDSLVELKNKFETTPVHSLLNNEMSMIGDVAIGTQPPLVFELIADKTQNASIDENNIANFICGDVKLYCNEKEIEDYEEKNIAFYLMRFGRWGCGRPEGSVDDNGELLSVRFTFWPESHEELEANGFAMLGNLSSMITEAFNEHTVYEQEVTALTSKAEPDIFTVHIPKEYEGNVLALWRLVIQAKPKTFQVQES
ncbi:hypothetical protein [Pantoea ananatis]|uniref:hypothetical protein n=1 Tax=Pantoea ananas TaxID=553 RepID=UPI001F4D3949|nr:hypothetical protein [Pantoea ananatis]MCH9269891.1 hypothetical protein [Pantoea ananatis]